MNNKLIGIIDKTLGYGKEYVEYVKKKRLNKKLKEELEKDLKILRKNGIIS
jgi:hypothetical protein